MSFLYFTWVGISLPHSPPPPQGIAWSRALTKVTQGLLWQPEAKTSPACGLRPAGTSGAVFVNVLLENESFMQILDNILGHIRTRLEAGLSGNSVMGVGTWPGKVNWGLTPSQVLSAGKWRRRRRPTNITLIGPSYHWTCHLQHFLLGDKHQSDNRKERGAYRSPPPYTLSYDWHL